MSETGKQLSKQRAGMISRTMISAIVTGILLIALTHNMWAAVPSGTVVRSDIPGQAPTAQSIAANKEALAKARASLASINKTTDPKKYFDAQIQIASALHKLADTGRAPDALPTLKEAVMAYREAAGAAKQFEDPLPLCATLDLLGIALGRAADLSPPDERQKFLKEALDAHTESVKLVPRPGNNDIFAGALSNKAMTQLLLKDYQGALDSCDESLRVSDVTVAQHVNRAHALLFLGKFPEAKIEYSKCLSDAQIREGVKDDLNRFEKLGLPKAEIDKVRELLPK